MPRQIKEPLVDFLRFFLHLHKLNSYIISSISSYEKLNDSLNNAKKLINKIENKEEEKDGESERIQLELKDTIAKEIAENFYTLKTSEIILIYSRLESAISETVYLVFKSLDITKISEIESVKINAIAYLKMTKSERDIFLADQYMIQMAQSNKYGFNRFESILKPIFGPSKLEKRHRDSLFKFAQVRNLLVHKNGVIDKQFKELYTNKKYKLNQQINIEFVMLEEFYSASLSYADDILDRVKSFVERQNS